MKCNKFLSFLNLDFFKRNFLIVLVLCICFCISAPFVSAETFSYGTMSNDGLSLDLMPYIEKTYYEFGSGISVINFLEAPKTNYRDFNILFYTNSDSFRVGSPTSNATIYNLGGYLYRAVGNFSNSDTPSDHPFIYFVSDESCYVNVLSVKYNQQEFQPQYIPYTATVKTGAGLNSYSNNGSSTIPFYLAYEDTYVWPVQEFFTVITIPAANLEKYDYIDFNLVLECVSISSIKVDQNNINYAFTSNIVNLGYTLENPYLENRHDQLPNITKNIGLSIDTSKQRIKSSGDLRISIDGTYLPYDESNCYLNFCIGFIVPNDSSIQSWLATLFVNLRTWFNSLIEGSSESNSAADSFNDSIDDQSNELEELTGDLNSVTRPPLSDVNLSTSNMVDSSVIMLTTNGIGTVISNPIILRVLILALTFALAGFILFGKR